jgi:hypothetical protein
MTKPNFRLQNLSFRGSGVIETFTEEVNLSLRDKIKISKSSIDIQFKKRVQSFIEELNSFDEEELVNNLDTIKKVFLDEVIGQTLIELLNSTSEKNLYTNLKLDSYNLTLEDVYELQMLLNSFGLSQLNDDLKNKFANKMLGYVKYKLALKRAKLLENVGF